MVRNGSHRLAAAHLNFFSVPRNLGLSFGTLYGLLEDVSRLGLGWFWWKGDFSIFELGKVLENDLLHSVSSTL